MIIKKIMYLYYHGDSQWSQRSKRFNVLGRLAGFSLTTETLSFPDLIVTRDYNPVLHQTLQTTVVDELIIPCIQYSHSEEYM